MEKLIAAIRDIGAKLEKGAFSNEDQVSKGVVMRLLRELEWDVFDPNRVSPEYGIERRRVDYALLREPFGPVVLIEVKRSGKMKSKGEEQLFDYCSKQGVPLAVLTDGRHWNFYFPSGMGSYEQRRFAAADLVDDDASDCAHLLARYLGFQAVVSGQSQKDAHDDYQTHWKQIAVREEFGPALDVLVHGADPRFVALFCDQVESRCGVRPDEAGVRKFLSDRSQPRTTPDPSPRSLRTPTTTRRSSVGRYFVTLRGTTKRFDSRKQLLLTVFADLAHQDPDFLARAAAHRLGAAGPPYLSRERSEIGQRPEALPGGWWLRSKFSDVKRMTEIIQRAGEVAGLVRGEDLIVRLD